MTNRTPNHVSDLPLTVERNGVTTVTPPVYAQERVIVVGGKAEETCTTCALWQQRYAAMGECMLPWAVDTAVRIEIVGGNELPSLMTPGYHYCKGYQQRGGE